MGVVSKHHPAKTRFPNPELVKEIADLTDISQDKAEKAIKAIAKSMKASLLRKEPIFIRGFGSFTLKEWKAHRHITQIKGGGHFMVPERTRVRFEIAKELFAMLNEKGPNGNT